MMIDGYLAADYRGVKQYDKALKIYNDFLVDDPNDWGILEDRGATYAGMGDEVHALADLNRSIEIDPKYSTAYGPRGLLYATQGQYDLAFKDLDNAIAHNGKDVLAYEIRCRVHLDHGDFKQGIDDCNQALKLEPGFSLAKVEKGAGQYFAGDYRAAADTLADFMNYQQEEPFGLLWLHLAKRRLGEDDAAALETQAQRLDPRRWPTLIVRYYQGKVPAEALQTATADPDPKEAAARKCDVDYFTGEALLLDGKTDAARQHIEHAIATCPKDEISLVGARAELGRM